MNRDIYIQNGPVFKGREEFRETKKMMNEIKKNPSLLTFHRCNNFLEFKISEDSFKKSEDHAYDYAEYFAKGDKNTHQGDVARTFDEVRLSALGGKISEFALYEFLNSMNITATPPDIKVFKGHEECDMTSTINCKNTRIDVKSTNIRGSLPLLPRKDYQEGERLHRKHDILAFLRWLGERNCQIIGFVNYESLYKLFKVQEDEKTYIKKDLPFGNINNRAKEDNYFIHGDDMFGYSILKTFGK